MSRDCPQRWSEDQVRALLACETNAEAYALRPDLAQVTVRHARSDWPNRYPHLMPGAAPMARKPEPEPQGDRPACELDGDSGTIWTGAVDSPVTDWSAVLKLWDLDPTKFEVIEPVTMKAWDMGIKNADGEIDTRRMYSYKAQIRRVAPDEVRFDVAAWRKALVRDPRPSARAKRPKSGTPSAYVIMVADPQLGKPGTEEAIANWQRGIRAHAERAADSDRVLLAFMGDEIEGVTGHYPSQTYAVELSLTKQIELDFDMRAWSIRQLMAVGLSDVVSVISNHGELSRVGGKQITTRSDNASTMVARLARTLFEDWEINWHIADGNPDVQLSLAGVKMSFSHGHVAKGTGKGEQRIKTAIERQILGRIAELGDVDIHVTAHYHHYSCIEDRGRTIVGCPALEAERASEWMMDQFGVWSRPGMLGFKVGKDYGPRGWSEMVIL